MWEVKLCPSRPLSWINLKDYLGAYESFPVSVVLWCFVCVLLFGVFFLVFFECHFWCWNGNSFQSAGDPLANRGIIIILVQVTLCFNLCLCHTLLEVNTGLAECDCSVFSFVFSSPGWTLSVLMVLKGLGFCLWKLYISSKLWFMGCWKALLPEGYLLKWKGNCCPVW